MLFCNWRFLFQESEEAKKLREERLAQYESKKSKSMSTNNLSSMLGLIFIHLDRTTIIDKLGWDETNWLHLIVMWPYPFL